MKESKTIWIVNYYCYPPQLDTHGRHLSFARMFMEHGYKVYIVMASSRGNTNFVDDFSPAKYLIKDIEQYHYIFIKTDNYEGNGLKRMYSIYKFGQSIQKLSKKLPKPDVIIHNTHAPFDIGVLKAAKKLDARYIAEDWDLWPEAFVTLGLVSRNNPLMRIAYRVHKKMFSNATDVVITLPGGLQYLKDRGWLKEQGGPIYPQNVHYINNGVDIKEFDYNKNNAIIDDPLLNDRNRFKLIYLGAIRHANNVKLLIDVMKELEAYPNIVLLIYGDGNEREQLLEYSTKLNLSNVYFRERRISLAQCAYVTSRADLNLVNYRDGFGMYGSSSGKLFLSLAAGKPIVCNVPLNFDDVINDNNLGVCKRITSPQEYANAILSIYNLDQNSYNEMCNRVRSAAKLYDYEYLASKMLKIIEKQ